MTRAVGRAEVAHNEVPAVGATRADLLAGGGAAAATETRSARAQRMSPRVTSHWPNFGTLAYFGMRAALHYLHVLLAHSDSDFVRRFPPPKLLLARRVAFWGRCTPKKDIVWEQLR